MPAADLVRLAGLRDKALSIAECSDAVADQAAGGVAVFVGAVRDTDDGRSVRALEYAAHPQAEQVLHQVAADVAGRYPVCAVAALHRVGVLAVGDVAVVVAASCPHRGEAFEAAHALIDDLKATVPIWKRQLFVDGASEWVGSP